MDEVEDALRSAGCAIVERLAPPDLLDRIEAELEPHLAATAPGGDDFAGRNTRRTGALIARSPAFRDLAAHPLVLGALDRVLGDHATSYQLHLTQVIEIGPGEPAQLVHRDQWAFDFFEFPAGFEVECHTMWAMTRLHRGERRDACHPGQQHVGRQAATRHEPTRSPAEMPQGLGAALPRLAVPRRRRQPLRRAAARHQRRLHAVVAAPGGEPVPRVPARGRA